MSDFDGFVAANDYSGEPVYIDIEITNEGTLPVDAKGEEKKNAERCSGSLCARRTTPPHLSRQRNFSTRSLEMMQVFGIVFGLNPSVFSDRKAVMRCVRSLPPEL